MSMRFGAHNLLEYDAKYCVLICRECRYAVQKSALGSHLLRHKIYRGERQRLLSKITQLNLLEPEEVRLPHTGSPPVDGLPILSGYKCTAPGCGNLCASSKRVRRHWREVHGAGDPSGSFARSVSLQTFFRGTKLRYFEVSSPNATLPATDRRSTQDHGLNIVATQNPPGPNFGLDLQTLRYFHHFMAITSLTLPVENNAVKHWQMEVVEQALWRRWLMYGLLTISASHLAALSEDETTKQVHLMDSALFSREFSAVWKVVQADFGAVEFEEARIGAQISCIHQCCHWTSDSLATSQEEMPEAVAFQWQSFMTTIQGCTDPNFALRAVSSDGIHEATCARVQNDLGGSSDAGVPNKVPLAILNRLRTLPYRMADALEKPDTAQDFFATLSAIDALVECFCLSYANDDVGAVCLGMGSWLRRLSVHFNRTLKRKSPAALVVVAHWSLLVERAESHCWFLRDSAAKLRSQIADDLPRDSAVQRLIGNLEG